MDSRIFHNLSSLAADISFCLQNILSCQSMKELLPIFKDFTVKLLQFSSVIKQIKKKARNELERESIALLLQSLKQDISELSSACQGCLKATRDSARKRQQEEVVNRIQFSINESLKIVKRIHQSEDVKLKNPNRVHNKRRIRKNSFSKTVPRDDFSADSSSSFLLHGVKQLFYDDQSLVDQNEVAAMELRSVKMKSCKVKKNAGLLIDNLSAENKDQTFATSLKSYTSVLDEGVLFTEQVEEFCQMMMIFVERYMIQVKPNIEAQLKDVKDLAKDLASIVIKCFQNGVDEEEVKSVYKLNNALDGMLSRIMEVIDDDAGVSGRAILDESFLMKNIKSITRLANEKNVIGIAEVTGSFIDAARESERSTRVILEANNPSNEGKIIRKRFLQALSQFEDCANDVIINVDDNSAVKSLEKKMKDVCACMDELKLTAAVTSKNELSAPSIKTEVEEEFPGKTHIVSSENLESLDVTKSAENIKHDRAFVDKLQPFFVAIADHDYRTVERLANHLVDDVRSIGSTLKNVPMKNSQRLNDLLQSYEKVYKLTGSFCSKARKAVLSDVDEQLIANLRGVGEELSQGRGILIAGCKTVLKPWIDIPISSMEELITTEEEKVEVLAKFTIRLNKSIETLNVTEYFEKHKLREEVMKLKKVVVNASTSISSSNKSSNKHDQNDSLEIYAIQWACAVIGIIGIIDQLSFGHKSCGIKKNDCSMIVENQLWISMLQDLAFGCSDEEICSEISEGIDELNEFVTKLESHTRNEKTGFAKQADLILLKRERSCKIMLLVELIDVLTREVSEPMKTLIDPLASLSFASSLTCYKEIRDAFQLKMETVETMACLAVEDSPSKTLSHLVFEAVRELMRVSEELLNSVSMPRNDTNNLELLKLQWRTKASYLIKVLMGVPEVKFTAVAGVMRHLHSASHVGHLDELVDILRDEGSPLRAYSQPVEDSRSAVSFCDYFGDDLLADQESILSSVLGSPLSRDTDLVSNSSPRLDSADMVFFQRFEDSLKHGDDMLSPLPLNQSPDTFQPLSSTLSTRSSSSQTQDTEIFIERPPVRPGRPSVRQDLRSDVSRSSTKQYSDVSHDSNQLNQSSKNQVKQSFMSNDDSRISKSIAAAAEILRREVEKWEEDGNSVVTVVKQMSNQMLQMADYAKGKGRLRSKQNFINTAKAIAANARMVAKFAVIIADNCLDKTCQSNLFHYAELVPTVSTQLKIIASVKAATPDDETADTMLIGNAENLMKYVLATLRAAESASVKLKKDELQTANGMPSKSAALTLQWKRKRDWQRTMESFSATTNELGLKIISNSPVLSMADL